MYSVNGKENPAFLSQKVGQDSARYGYLEQNVDT